MILSFLIKSFNVKSIGFFKFISISQGLGLSNRNLTTEVGILESPSVLMPAFEFVKKQKLNLNKNKKLMFFLKIGKKIFKNKIAREELQY